MHAESNVVLDRSRVSPPWLIVIAVALFLSGCASSGAPSRWLPEANEMQWDTYGSWIEVHAKRDGKEFRSEGEFLGIRDEAVFVLKDDGIDSLPREWVQSAKVTSYRSHQDALAAWVVLGTLSSVAHGFYGAISAPAWILVGSICAAVQSHAPIHHCSEPGCLDVARFARYPQGVPLNIRSMQLAHKTLPPKRW